MTTSSQRVAAAAAAGNTITAGDSIAKNLVRKTQSSVADHSKKNRIRASKWPATNMHTIQNRARRYEDEEENVRLKEVATPPSDLSLVSYLMTALKHSMSTLTCFQLGTEAA